MAYQWGNPGEWLDYKVRELFDQEDRQTLAWMVRELADKADADTIQDCFEGMMDDDGYFEQVDEAELEARKGDYLFDMYRDEGRLG